MKFKDPRMKDQLDGCRSALNMLAEYADHASRRITGKEIIITRVTDRVEGESGVHPAGRAFDFRFQTSVGTYYTREQAQQIVDEINGRFPRTDGKKTCILHSFNGGMEHFHCQIPYIIPSNWPKSIDTTKTS